MRAITMLVILLASVSTWADVDIAMYQRERNDPSAKVRLDAYVFGLGEGLSWANVELMARNHPPIFCEPKNISLNADNYKSLIDDSLKKVDRSKMSVEQFNKVPLGLLLKKGLMDAFPCSNTSQRR